MRQLTLAAGIGAIVIAGACKRTGEGEYEVKKPVIGTETDTVRTPSVETGAVKDTVEVPRISTERKEVEVPKAKVVPPEQRK